MQTVGSHEAKTHFASLLERVAQGEKITITKHGVPIAMIVPADTQTKRDPKEVIAQIKQARKGRKLCGVTIRQLIEAGRRH